ncbi:MAG: PQQ-binding-like beta-propeller repeat protein [Nannocystaceae bacterium]|nr:PQQ-binding-like beta-propeller repeat protein [Myxococcales bacterium]
MTKRASLAAALLLLGCGGRDSGIELYAPEGDAARGVVATEFIQPLLEPDNFVLRPDEFAAVATDHERGLIYVGNRQGTLFALDGERGGVVWEERGYGAISSKPVITANSEVLLFGTDDGALLALDLETRKPRWTYETPGTIRNEPLIVGQILYFANSRDQVYALDLGTGEWRWQYPTDESLFQTDFTVHGRAGLSYLSTVDDGVTTDGVVFTGFDDGRVVALGANSGAPIWTVSVAPPERGDFIDADGTPLVDADAGEVVVSGHSTGVYGLSIDDGAERWFRPVRGAGTVVAGPGGVLVFCSSLEGIYGIERGGRVRWHKQVDPGVLSAPLVARDTLFVTHSESGLLAFDVRTGEFLARLGTGSGISSPATFDPMNDRLYAVSNRGDLLVFRVTG